MPPRASARSARGRGRGGARGRGRSRRIVDDDDDVDVSVEGSDGNDEAGDTAMKDGQDSDGSDYASSADEDEDNVSDSDASVVSDSDASDAPTSKQAKQTKQKQKTKSIQYEDTDAVDHRIPTYTEAARVVRTTTGPYKRGDPPRHIARTIYGPGAALFSDMCERWSGLLPSASEGDANGGVLASPWLPEHFEDEQVDALRRWYAGRPSAPAERLSVPANNDYFPFDGTAYILPAGSDNTHVLKPGACIGLPAEGDAAVKQMVADLGGEAVNDDNNTADSFLLHAGGEVQVLAWAPVGSSQPQLLAIAAAPHAKHDAETETEDVEDPEASGVLDPQLQLSEDLTMNMGMGQPSPGSIQLWSMPLNDDDTLPRLESVVCFDWGWPKRMAWCPVPLVYDADELSTTSHAYGMLAVLTDDGIVRVIDVKVESSSQTQPAFVHTPPIATLQIQDEPGAAATCLSWVGIGEIVVGHADGSLTLWDIGSQPSKMLLRLPVHDDCVLDICSAYPSHPYLVASRPVQGVPRLVDLRRPAVEHTYHPNPSVGFQPALLAWSDHLQGFASTAATNNPVNGRLDFFPATHFPLPLFLVPHTSASLPTCLGTATAHPYLAVGRSDGSVVVINMLESMFRSARKNKIKAVLHYVFNSEWRSVAKNSPSVGSLAVRTLNTTAYEGVVLGTLGLAKHAAQTAGDDTLDDDDAEGDGDAEGEEGADLEADMTGATGPSATYPFRGPSLMRIHDPQTRVVSVAWNPNLEYGTWCAIGLASGMVSIKKLAPKPV